MATTSAGTAAAVRTARLLAPADTWDVVTRVRSYKAAPSVATALSEARRQRGLRFASDVVTALESIPLIEPGERSRRRRLGNVR